MKWWHVLLFSFAYPFLLGNIRVYRFESHPKPILAFSTIGLFFTAFSVVVYIMILYEIAVYYLSEHFFVCHTIDFSDRSLRMSSVLWFFHVSRVFFDLVNTIQSALTKPVSDLRSEQAINEIRFTLTHFLVWWLTLLYQPGGEVIYPIATVCLFYLGTIACAFSPGRFINLKMAAWIILVVTNFSRLGFDLWYGCKFPSAVLTISPPYDINTNVHMVVFYFLSWIPAGFIFHYLLYARGTVCSWWIVLIFLICAHWPSLEDKKSKYDDDDLLMDSSLSSLSSSKKDRRKKKLEKARELKYDPKTLHEFSLDLHKSKSSSSKSSSSSRSNVFRKCSRAMCSNYESKPKEFKVCLRCRSPYCSRECQLQDWDQYNHKMYCKKFSIAHSKPAKKSD